MHVLNEGTHALHSSHRIYFSTLPRYVQHDKAAVFIPLLADLGAYVHYIQSTYDSESHIPESPR